MWVHTLRDSEVMYVLKPLESARAPCQRLAQWEASMIRCGQATNDKAPAMFPARRKLGRGSLPS